MNESIDTTASCSRRQLIQGVAAGGLTALVLPGCSIPAAMTSAAATAEKPYDAWHQTLAGHKIDRIEHREVQNRWPRLVGRNARLDVHGWGYRTHVCIIHTDTGAMGWGMAGGLNPEKAAAYTAQLRGKPITDLFTPATGTLEGVHKHLDLALHDLAGIILDIPVYQMIGGTQPVPVPCYSGMIYFDDLEPYDEQPGVEQVLFNAGADHHFGYRQMKIKVGRGNKWMEHQAGLARDIEVTNELAKAFPDVKFLADANDGFSVDDTLAYLDAIETELLFMEEPFAENPDGFAKLRRFLEQSRSKTLIADGEFRPDYALLDRLIEADLLDVHLTDVYGLGFTKWRKLMPTLIERGVQTSPHTWGNRLKTVYATHLASGFGNVLTVEGVTAFSRDIDFADYDLDADGNIAPPNKPGFGLTLRDV